MPLKKLLLPGLLLFVSLLHAQTTDSVQKKRPEVVFSTRDNIQLYNARALSAVDSLLHPELRIGGYVSTYYAYYDDEIETNGFVQFPTLAPRNNQFSLNTALISMEYRSNNVRSNITLHYGDIPQSAWPADYNLVQEANAGFKVMKKLWIDGGFFKSHVGLGSFQPRENITSSMSVPDFYNPYYFAGAKLTCYLTSKISLQLSSFNGPNVYVETNKNKAFGFSANYSPRKEISVTYNFLTCDESPEAESAKHQRMYHNAFATYTRERYILTVDMTFGSQQHSTKTDSSKTATMYSGTFVGKYVLLETLAAYGRLEYFSDPHAIFTGTLDIGDNIQGVTAGIEYKPHKNAALSIEGRHLQSDHVIFRQGNTMLNQRNEFIVCLDLWF